MNYQSQLDGLRWFAALGVLAWHLLPFWYYRVGVGGGVFVHMFFVLSSFLATMILLRYRQKTEDRHNSLRLKWRMYRSFQMRRVLRLFPVYYLIVLCFAIFWVREGAFNDVWWHAAWLTNWFTLFYDYHWPMAHLWSLAIEQQFYLVWSVFLLLMPLRWIPLIILCLIPLAPISRYVLLNNGVGAELVRMVPTSCLDTWGIGSLLASMLLLYPQSRALDIFRRYGGYVALTLLLIFFPYKESLDIFKAREYVGYFPFLLALMYGWLVLCAWWGFTGFGGWLLSNRVSVQLGKVSYGIYIFHVPMWYVTGDTVYAWIESSFLVHIWGAQAFAYFLIQSTLSIILALASYYLFERYFHRFKKYFPYYKERSKRPKAVQGAPSNAT